MEIATDPHSNRPDLVDIARLAKLLLPEIRTETEFDKAKKEL